MATRGIQKKEKTLVGGFSDFIETLPLKFRVIGAACLTPVVASKIANISDPFIRSFHLKPLTNSLLEFGTAATVPFVVSYFNGKTSMLRMASAAAVFIAAPMIAIMVSSPIHPSHVMHSLPPYNGTFDISLGFTTGVFTKGVTKAIGAKINKIWPEQVQWLKSKLRQERPDSYLPT